jgi:hypothetical protein
MVFRQLGATLGMSVLLAATVLPACSATANVSEVWTSVDEDGARRRSTFFTDSAAVVCLAEYGNGRQDVTIEMLIRQIRGADFGAQAFREENIVTSVTDFRPGVTQGRPGKAVIRLLPSKIENGKFVQDDEAPFSPGSYICEVRIDGALKGSASFNIDYPECPGALILQDQRCQGFYPTGTTCPAAGLTGDPQPTCQCTPKGWNCA